MVVTVVSTTLVSYTTLVSLLSLIRINSTNITQTQTQTPVQLMLLDSEQQLAQMNLELHQRTPPMVSSTLLQQRALKLLFKTHLFTSPLESNKHKLHNSNNQSTGMLNRHLMHNWELLNLPLKPPDNALYLTHSHRLHRTKANCPRPDNVVTNTQPQQAARANNKWSPQLLNFRNHLNKLGKQSWRLESRVMLHFTCIQFKP